MIGAGNGRVMMIEDTLNYLLDCYPAFEPKGKGFWLTWRKRLEAYDADVVQQAAEMHVEVRHGRFFPSLPELIGLVEMVRGMRELDNPKVVRDDLMVLEQDSMDSGDVDRDAFEILARRFERLDMPASAAWVRERFWRMAIQLGRAKPERLADAQRVRVAALAGMVEALHGQAVG